MSTNPLLARLGTLHAPAAPISPISPPSGDRTGPRIFRRRASTVRKKLARLARLESAATALGAWNPGDTMALITRGDFALTDLLAAAVDRLGGGVDATLSAWIASAAELDFVAGLRESGRLASVRLLLDSLVASREPTLAEGARLYFGADRVCFTRNRARFALLAKGKRRAAITSTSDLSFNRGFELFFIDCDRALHDWLSAHADDVFRAHAGQTTNATAAISATFDLIP